MKKVLKKVFRTTKSVFTSFNHSYILGRELIVLSTKQEIDCILYKALQPLKSGGKISGALKVWVSMDNENYDVSQARCTNVINLAHKHAFCCKEKTNNGSVRVFDRYIDVFINASDRILSITFIFLVMKKENLKNVDVMDKIRKPKKQTKKIKKITTIRMKIRNMSMSVFS